MKLFLLCAAVLFVMVAKAQSSEVSIEGAVFEKVLGQAYEELKKDPTPVAWQFESSRHRVGFTCQQQCDCIATRLSRVINDKPKFKLVSRAVGGFYVQNAKNIKTYYNFHVTLVVHLDDKTAAYIDPLLFGDTKFHTREEWEDHFEDLDVMKFELIPIDDI